jgi:type I restriction-modification system DNA methylase subunit
MAFFQNSVINKYIAKLDKQTVQNAYAKFRAHFHNATIQDNIRGSKEEQYQGEFLIDLFVNVLGYTKNPTPNFNLTTEYKNVKDSKKADGAIIINEIVKAVIELKGTNTTDLNKIEVQAFGYKNNQPECEYVITSNFEKLRFYVDNAIEYLEFNLFTLSEKEFELLYICLSYDSIAKGLPKQIKDESVSQEALITKKLYQDYSVFKNELYHSLVKLNPQYEPLELFKKSQKLLDRFLFIFFAEDRQLLPTNLIFRINKEWQQLREMRIEVSLYDRYKIYFNDLNLGAKVSLPAFSQTASKQKEEFEIYAYNGGLFTTDELLNDIKIDDALLFSHTEKLSNYDFASEVDVNVLGHIFENSLNDVDEIKAQLEGQEVDKTKTKRKKDGVFYTPKYITKYIVDNTVGKLCIEKKEELKINEEDYKVDKKRTTKAKQLLLDNLEAYRKWLLQLTICDPACGSGAFLNQALDFLITEHAYIDELQAKVLNVPMVLSDIEGSILENNLFGVDINEESVEIAKLSLWLRTAQPNRKLNDLNSNIKCGNSLIDDVSVAGDKAFNWNNSFKEVFEKGGFDVLIGNPPYGANFDTKEKEYLKLKYKEIHVRTPESFNYFIGQIINISKNNGVCSFIIPSSFLNQIEFEKTRKLILEKFSLTNVLDLGDNVFSNVATPTCIIGIYKDKSDSDIRYCNLTSIKRDFLATEINKSFSLVPIKSFIENQSYSFIFKPLKKIIDKCYDNNYTLKEIAEDVATGISPGLGEAFVIDKVEAEKLKLEDEILKNLVIGGEINRYHLAPISNKVIIYFSSQLDIKDFPNCLSHLSKYKGKLDNRVETKSGAIPWYVMLRPRRQKLFEEPKILIRQTADRIIAAFDEEKWYCLKSGLIIQLPKNSELNYKFLLCLLNSNLMDFLYKDLVNEENRIFPEVKPIQLFKLPIKQIVLKEQEKFIGKSNIIHSLNKDLLELVNKFERSIGRKFNLASLPKKLEDWYLLSYSDFIKELAKKKVKLSLSDEAEWEEYFNTEAKKALELKSKIDATDKEIDQMVYKLYNLTEEEISIVEKS